MEDAPEQTEQVGNEDGEGYKDEHDMDDEIDFNLGGGQSHEAHGPGIKEDG